MYHSDKITEKKKLWINIIIVEFNDMYSLCLTSNPKLEASPICLPHAEKFQIFLDLIKSKGKRNDSFIK